jgi:hypothetical protein
MIYTILLSSGSHKKSDMNSLIFFPAVTLISQFSNFKVPVIPTSLVILLVLEVFIILGKSTTSSELSGVLSVNF